MPWKDVLRGRPGWLKTANDGPGSFAFNQAFQPLGQEAGKEIFMDPNVMKDMATMSKSVDHKKLADLVGS